MNVTFHAFGSFAAAAVLSLGKSEDWRSRSTLKKHFIGFAAGVIAHGALDYLPHQYPLASKIDVALALLLFLLFLAVSHRRNFLLVLICFAGGIFPDVIDLGPAIAAKHLGIPIPQIPFRVFPWHLKQYSGSIYDGSRAVESAIYHISVLLIGFGLLYAYRKRIFRFWEN